MELPRLSNTRLGYWIGIGLFTVGLALTLAGLYFGYRYVVGLPIPAVVHGTVQEASTGDENDSLILILPGAIIAIAGFNMARKYEG